MLVAVVIAVILLAWILWEVSAINLNLHVIRHLLTAITEKLDRVAPREPDDFADDEADDITFP